MSNVKTTKRPIDKVMKTRSEAGIGTSQSNGTVHTSVVAETVIRQLGYYGIVKGGSTSVVTGSILLVLVRDGKTASTVSLANNGVT